MDNKISWSVYILVTFRNVKWSWSLKPTAQIAHGAGSTLDWRQFDVIGVCVASELCSLWVITSEFISKFMWTRRAGRGLLIIRFDSLLVRGAACWDRGTCSLVEHYTGPTACVGERRGFLRDCADAQARLSFRWLHMWRWYIFASRGPCEKYIFKLESFHFIFQMRWSESVAINLLVRGSPSAFWFRQRATTKGKIVSFLTLCGAAVRSLPLAYFTHVARVRGGDTCPYQHEHLYKMQGR